MLLTTLPGSTIYSALPNAGYSSVVHAADKQPNSMPYRLPSTPIAAAGFLTCVGHLIAALLMQLPQVKELLALPSSQALLKRCRSAEALVLLLPPFKEGPPVDDGTRLMTDMARLTAAFEAVLELQAVPYEVVTAADRFDRVKEVCGLLGMSTSGWPCI